MIGTSGIEGRKSTLVPSDGNFDVLYWAPQIQIGAQSTVEYDRQESPLTKASISSSISVIVCNVAKLVRWLQRDPGQVL
jgi:hypothetical protein